MAETLDDAVELERVAFEQPFDGACEIIGRGRRVKIVPDGGCVRCREEFGDVNRRLRIGHALEWVDARWHYV